MSFPAPTSPEEPKEGRFEQDKRRPRKQAPQNGKTSHTLIYRRRIGLPVRGNFWKEELARIRNNWNRGLNEPNCQIVDFAGWPCWLRPIAERENQQKIKGPDEAYKVDILVVVAHPDDEGAVTPYLARAIYDLHKTVGVVFGTRGGSAETIMGANTDRRWRTCAKLKRGKLARTWHRQSLVSRRQRHRFRKTS